MARRRNALPAMIALILVSAAQADEPAQPTTAELMEQIRQLQQKVEQLEARQRDDSLSAASVDATVDSVMRDAQRRSELLQVDSFTAGYHDGKFLIQSADGNFVLNPSFQLQVRHVSNYRDDAAPDGDEDLESGFELRRTKIGFKGNAINPRLTYNFRFAFSRNGGQPLLEDAYVQYRFSDSPWYVRGGQWKDNVIHEEHMSSTRQLAVERSLLNATLQGTVPQFVHGAALGYAPDGSPFRAELALHDGLNSRNTGFQDGLGGAAGIAPNYGGSARVDYLAQGEWKGYDDFTAKGNKQDLLVLGGGAHYSEGGDDSILLHTLDAQWEPWAIRGLGFYAAGLGRYLTIGGTSGWDWGLLVQSGYMLDEKWELFGRYDVIFLDDALLAPGAEDMYHEFTVGANYYISGHTKLTLDISYLPEGAPSDQTGLGVLAGEGDQFIVRAQFQLVL